MGLTSDDEDYIDPTEDGSVSEEPGADTKASSSSSNHKLEEGEKSKVKRVKKSTITKEEESPPVVLKQIPTDMTDRYKRKIKIKN